MNGRKSLIAKWSVIWMPFEYQTKFSPVFTPPLKYRTSIQMVVWITDHNLNTRHLNTVQVKVCYSDVFVIYMFFFSSPLYFFVQKNSLFSCLIQIPSCFDHYIMYTAVNNLYSLFQLSIIPKLLNIYNVCLYEINKEYDYYQHFLPRTLG